MMLDYDLATPREKTRADVALLVLRVMPGILFLLAGITKISSGVGGFVAANVAKAPLPEGLAKAYLYCVPWAEVIVGICLIVGLATRRITFIAFLMVLSFSIAVTKFNPRGAGAPNLMMMAVLICRMLLRH